MRENLTDYDEVSEYGDTNFERWLHRHDRLVHFLLGIANGLFIGLYIGSVVG